MDDAPALDPVEGTLEQIGALRGARSRASSAARARRRRAHPRSALFSQGHLLIEDVPGVGKTDARAGAGALARRLVPAVFSSRATCCRRISSGVSIYQPATSQSFEFKPGPVFSHVVLADEINRATPKTQSAMLEAMNEAQVSVDSNTFPVPRRSWCWPRRTRLSTRAPILFPSRSSTDSS